MPTLRYHRCESPLGELLLTGDGEALSGLYLSAQKSRPEPSADWRHDPGAFRPVCEQLRAYFAGDLQRFEVILRPQGSAFQLRVWSALLDIGYGETCSYGALAARIGQASAARAVGLANGRNPIAILIPCHRVIGTHGALTGYAGGLARKQWLLAHEQATRNRSTAVAQAARTRNCAESK